MCNSYIFIWNRLSDKSCQYAENSIHSQGRHDYKIAIYKNCGVQQIVVPEGLKNELEYILAIPYTFILLFFTKKHTGKRDHENNLQKNINSYFFRV